MICCSPSPVMDVQLMTINSVTLGNDCSCVPVNWSPREQLIVSRRKEGSSGRHSNRMSLYDRGQIVKSCRFGRQTLKATKALPCVDPYSLRKSARSYTLQSLCASTCHLKNADGQLVKPRHVLQTGVRCSNP